jgi:hypothetical protein
MLSDIYAVCHMLAFYAECHVLALNAEFHYAECRCAEYRYVESRSAIQISYTKYSFNWCFLVSVLARATFLSRMSPRVFVLKKKF